MAKVYCNAQYFYFLIYKYSRLKMMSLGEKISIANNNLIKINKYFSVYFQEIKRANKSKSWITNLLQFRLFPILCF